MGMLLPNLPGLGERAGRWCEASLITLQAFAEYETWTGCPSKTGTHVSRSAKGAHRCGSVRTRTSGCTEPERL